MQQGLTCDCMTQPMIMNHEIKSASFYINYKRFFHEERGREVV